MNRGACRQPIFSEPIHYEMFLELLAEITLRYNIEIHAYCFMSNHYHLLIRTPKCNLSKAMKHLSSVYTMRYNNLQAKTDGPLFRGRFKAKIIEAEKYLIQVFRYIHLNPSKANIVERLEQYKWSSFPAYINKVKAPFWLYTNEVLKQFTSDKQYEEIYQYTMQGNSAELEDIYSSEKSPPIIGDDEFIEKLKSKKNYYSISEEVTDKRFLRPSIEDIIQVVSKVTGDDPNIICSKKRAVKNPSREIVMLIAKSHYAYKLVEISKVMHMSSYSSVSSATFRTSRKISNSPELNEIYIQCLKELKRNYFD